MLNKEVIRFLIAGGINTLFYYFLYSTFIYLNFDYKLAVLFATSIGMFFSFYTFGSYVFKNSQKKLLLRFISNYILLYFLNIFIINEIHTSMNENLYISGLLSTVVISILTFFLNKFFVFKKSTND